MELPPLPWATELLPVNSSGYNENHSKNTPLQQVACLEWTISNHQFLQTQNLYIKARTC